MKSEEEVFYTKQGGGGYSRGSRGRGRGRSRSNFRGGRGSDRNQDDCSSSDSGKECFICRSKEHLSYNCPKNENRNGNRAKCFICDSPEHLANN